MLQYIPNRLSYYPNVPCFCIHHPTFPFHTLYFTICFSFIVVFISNFLNFSAGSPSWKLLNFFCSLKKNYSLSFMLCVLDLSLSLISFFIARKRWWFLDISNSFLTLSYYTTLCLSNLTLYKTNFFSLNLRMLVLVAYYLILGDSYLALNPADYKVLLSICYLRSLGWF